MHGQPIIKQHRVRKQLIFILCDTALL